MTQSRDITLRQRAAVPKLAAAQASVTVAIIR